MPFRVSGKNIDIGETLRERVNDRIKGVVGKYFDGGFSGHVTISKEGHGFRSDCAVHLDTGITLHVELLYGVNNHHIIEGIFKGFARAMRQAVEIDPRKADAVPSTKGILGG